MNLCHKYHQLSAHLLLTTSLVCVYESSSFAANHSIFLIYVQTSVPWQVCTSIPWQHTFFHVMFLPASSFSTIHSPFRTSFIEPFFNHKVYLYQSMSGSEVHMFDCTKWSGICEVPALYSGNWLYGRTAVKFCTLPGEKMYYYFFIISVQFWIAYTAVFKLYYIVLRFALFRLFAFVF